MSYRTMLVHLDAHPRRVALLDFAFRLASRFDSHLVALFAIDPMPIPRVADAHWSTVLVDAGAKQWKEAEDAARRDFDAVSRQYSQVVSEWRSDSGAALAAITLSARYADLVIARQQDPDSEQDPHVPQRFAEELVLAAERAVLLMPYIGSAQTLGRQVMLAWDASPQAMRAATAALPLLEKADQVRVAVFDAEKHRANHGEQPGADIALFLARHGVKASVALEQSVDGDVGIAILSRVADLGIDLVVMGAYGHSRTRERILGGATRTLMETMTVPVLMAH